MFTTNLDSFKVQQKELHRQAAEYHLVRSLTKESSPFSRLARSLGETLIASGQELSRGSHQAH